jgi:hypothetical protein
MQNSYSKSLLRTFVKACLLALFIALDFGAIFLDVGNVNNTSFGEDGYVEWFQEVQLFTAFLFLILALKKNKSLQPAIIFMAGCLAMSIIREYNNFFIEHVFHGAWSVLVMIAGLNTLYFLYKQKKNILSSFHHFTQTTSYGIVVSGFFVTFIFSRFMGIPDFWHAALGKNYVRDVERMVEESTELIGYTIIAFGCIDYTLMLRKAVE